MKLTHLPNEFQEALPVLRKIQEAGFEAYFVGGSVRDVLLKMPIHDVDIATSAFPEEVKKLFPKTFDVGIEHGTVMVLAENNLTYEITTFRTESTYQDFRRPDHVKFVRSLKDDLRRRDFTINALALKEDGEIIDLFDGITDMQQQVLRAVGDPHERFHEDALRMMRGLRFVSQLGFSLDSQTFAAILENHTLLEKISVERIHVEFIKLLMGKHRQTSLIAFVETECYQYCPGLRNQGAGLLHMKELPELTIGTEAQAWTLLVYCLNFEDSKIADFLKEWKCSNQLIREVQRLSKGLNYRLTNSWSKTMLYHLKAQAINQVEELMPFFGEENQTEAALHNYQILPIHHLQELAVSGHDLLSAVNRKPGKWVSEALSSCEEAVVTGQLINHKEILLAYVLTKL